MVPAHRVGGHAEALLQHGARVVVAQPPLADVAGPVHHHGVRLVRHLEVGRVEADREPFPVRSGHGDLGLAGPGVELATDLREVAQCPEKAPTIAFSLLKVILLRIY